MNVATIWRYARALGSFAFVTSTSALAFGAPAPADDIRDIRGPIAIPLWWIVPLAVVACAIVAAAVVLFVRWWRARSARALSALELALQALTVAETRAREGLSHEWADIVAKTTRDALAARLGTQVLPQTTGELAKAPWAQPPGSHTLDAPTILGLLQTCDLARFAKASLDTKALLEATESAREVTKRLFEPRPPTSAQPVTS